MTNATTSPHTLPSQALDLLARLEEQRVELVLIGDLAAAVHGVTPRDTTVVVVPARFRRNLDRLARGLRNVHARPADPSPISSSTPELGPTQLAALGRWRLLTDFGRLELDFEPPATAGHIDLFENARRMPLGGPLAIEVAALADLVRIAEMRRSPGDEAMLPGLRAALGPGAA